MFWIIVFLFFIILLIYSIKSYIYRNDDYWVKQGVPILDSSETGSIWDILNGQIPMQDMSNVLYKKFKSMDKKMKFGGTMEFRRPVGFIMDLDLIRLVTVKDFDHFVNHRMFGRKDDPTLMHKMLFNMDSVEWKITRSAVTPTFTTGKIRRMFEVFNESSRKMNIFLKEASKNAGNDGVDFHDVYGRYTMDVIASVAFGVDSLNFKEKNSTFSQMGNRFQNHFSGFTGIMKFLLSDMSPGLFKLLGLTSLDPVSVTFFKDVIFKTIQHREKTGEKRNDFLQLIIEARNGTLNTEKESDTSIIGNLEKDTQSYEKGNVSKAVWTDDLIAAQCITFIAGGFDTTETLLIYTAYELALNQDIQERLFKEVDEAIQKHGELNYEVVHEMEYLDMVISETLRKYPPSIDTNRRCTKDYKVPDSKYEIKKDTIVTIPIWSIHRDADIYPEPDKFIPERFTKEEKDKRHPYAYIPFGAGPRICIAQRFALTEGKAAIAHLVHKFHLQPSVRTTIPMKYMVSVTIKPIDGMWLNVTPRILKKIP